MVAIVLSGIVKWVRDHMLDTVGIKQQARLAELWWGLLSPVCRQPQGTWLDLRVCSNCIALKFTLRISACQLTSLESDILNFMSCCVSPSG